MISKETAADIAFAHREIEVAQKLLNEIAEAIKRYEAPDIRDAFGRQLRGLQLGVPSGESSQRCFNVPWALAKPVLEAHISDQKNLISALNEKARIELQSEAV